jgi:hypothetical protein
MNRCLKCGAYMHWSYEKGWYCPNGCVIKTTTSNHIEILECSSLTTNTTITLEKEEPYANT